LAKRHGHSASAAGCANGFYSPNREVSP
jgi:hypothetical protein